MNSQAIQLYALFCAIFFVTEILCEAKVLTFLDLTEQNLLEVVSKCIPCLLLFIWFRKNGKRLEKLGDDETVQRNKCITMGFLFSAIGDAAMVYCDEGGLPLGMLTFGIAHLFYIKAFGFAHTNRRTGMLLYSTSIFMALSMFAFEFFYVGKIQGVKLIISIVGVNLYSALLYTTLWRSLDIQDSSRNSKQLMCPFNVRASGLLAFVVSDNIIALNLFAYTIPLAWVPIMVLYYAAQGAIAWAEGQTLMVDLDTKSH